MKKYLSMICCLGALLTAGCSDDKAGEEEGPTGEAKITAFGFKAENNPDYLVKDYTGTISGTAISVKVPADTDLSALVATFETADGESTVTVNGTMQVSGTTANDFSDPVDYLVSLGKKNALYTVTVSELPEAVWEKVGEMNVTLTHLRMEINPVDNKPYFAITEKTGGATYGNLLYASVNGSNISSVVVQTAPTQNIGFGFDKFGKAYMSYYNSTEKVGHVTTDKSGSWSLESVTYDQPQNTGVGPTICETNNGNIFVFTANNAASGSLGKRELNMTVYDGTSWLTQQTIPGRSGYTYWPVARVKGDVMYLLTLNPVTPNSFSVYTYKSGNWKTVIDSFAYVSSEPGAETTTYYTMGARIPDMDIDNDGNIYINLTYKLGTAYMRHVMKATYNPNTDSYEINRLGSPLNTDDGDNGRIAVSPLGVPYAIFRNSRDTKQMAVVSLDSKTKDWTPATIISSDQVETEFEFKFAKDGTAYLAYYVLEEKTDDVVTTPAKLCLYKLATAE